MASGIPSQTSSVDPARTHSPAPELHMSVATVKAHVSRLLAELEADNRVQIALLVQEARR